MGSMLREFEAKEGFIKKKFKDLLEDLDRKREELLKEEAKMLDLLKQEYASVLATRAGKKVAASSPPAQQHNTLNVLSILSTNNNNSKKQMSLERTKMEANSTLKQDCNTEAKDQERETEKEKEQEKEKEEEMRTEEQKPSCCCSGTIESEEKEEEKEKEKEKEEKENGEQKEEDEEEEKDELMISEEGDMETDSESPSQKSDSEDNAAGSGRMQSPESEYMIAAKASAVTKRSMAITSLLLDSDQIDNFPPPSSCCFSKSGCNCSSASKPSFKRKRQVTKF